MKKHIALSTILLSSIMTIGLANAAEQTTKQNPTDTMTQGSVPEQQVPSNSDRLAAEKRWRQAKTCTDKDGITYNRGQAGFETCIQNKIDQLGGTVGSEQNLPNPDLNQMPSPNDAPAK